MNPARRVLTLLSTCAIACAPADAPDKQPELEMRKANAAADKGKVAICHVAGDDHHTIVVAAPAIPAHLGHGDTVGECTSGCTSESCNDDNLCTSDACLPDGTCSNVAIVCEDDNSCTHDSCHPGSGCEHAPVVDGVPCEDGNECTDDDVCCVGQCRGTPIDGCCLDASDCDDDNACSNDACIGNACANTPVGCADADPCVVGFCDPTTGECDGAPLDCDDANACTIDTCGAQGCVHTQDLACGTNVEIAIGELGANQLPRISGTHVIWTARQPNSRFDVLLHDHVTGESQNLTNTTAEDEVRADIDGEWAIWHNSGAVGLEEIVAHNLVSGERIVIEGMTPTTNPFNPAMGDGLVAYSRAIWDPFGPQIALYDLEQRVLLPDHPELYNGENARVRAGRVLHSRGNGGGLRLFTVASASSVPVLETWPGGQYDLDGQRVVYVVWDGPIGSIFVYDIATGVTQPLPTAQPSYKSAPRISGNRVVWQDDRGGDVDLYVYDFDAALELPLVVAPGLQTPEDFEGDRLVYTTRTLETDAVEVFTFGGGA
ncbi:MAG TPA: hypothetical protein VG755_18245 [Nannocystaceae bacterium]|nr:hypothetical protein [Nannocystaceae bacterium]